MLGHSYSRRQEKEAVGGSQKSTKIHKGGEVSQISWIDLWSPKTLRRRVKKKTEEQCCSKLGKVCRGSLDQRRGDSRMYVGRARRQ